MGKLLRLAGVALLAWCCSVSRAGPENPVAPVKVKDLAAGSLWTVTATFKAGERACAVAVGESRESYLGLYVFDGHGNCVAHDDGPGGEFRNDRAVLWFPTRAQAYTIAVRNLGSLADSFDIALRK